MPAPSKWNRKAKARNDRRAAARSGGGRTASEAAFGRSQRAAGRTVSRTNTRVPRAKRPRAVRTPLARPEVQTSIERLREKYGAETLDRGNRESRQVNTEVSQKRDKAERRLENTALRAMPTRGEALKAAPLVRAATQLNAEGTRVERLLGAKQVGNEGVGAVQRAAERGQVGREGDRFTTPRVRRTRRKVKRAKREVRRAKAAAKRSGRINIPGGEGVFINRLARETGLNPRVVAAWTKSEGGNRFGDYNLLNIGHTGSGPNSAAANGNFADPVSAAKATAAFLRGEWGGAGAGIPNIIRQARGKDPATQIRVIEQSGWRLGRTGPDPKYSNLITSVFNEQPGVTKANPRAKRRLERAEARAETIDEEAARLGLPGTKGLSKEGKRDIEENYRIRQEKGEWAGSQALIQKILGAGPNLASDKEARGTGSYHDTGNLTSYAQDIPLSGGLEKGEPVYNQALLDRVTRRIRRMGGEVPDLKVGMGYTTGYLQGYTLEIIPDSESNWHGSGPHLHIGATWTGEKPPPGTQLGGSGGATGSVGPGGTSFPSSSPNAPGGPVTREQRRKAVLGQLRDLGFNVTPSGIRRTGLAAGSTMKAPKSVSKVKERYGIK